MATAYNLKRNSRVFFTTNVAAGTNVVNTSGFTVANTQELTVLDGFSFTQTTTASPITVSEAGATPSRGQRSFNTALNPVDFSFSTYVRPNFNLGIANQIDCDEADLWNALFGITPTTDAGITLSYVGALTPAYTPATGILTLTAATSITATGLNVGDIISISGVTGAGASQFNSPAQCTAITATVLTFQYLTAPTATVPAAASWPTGAVFLNKKSWISNVAQAADTPAAAYAEVTPARSNANQLVPFGMIIVVDGITYTIDNCAMDQASIDFGLDAITTVAWTGKGTQLNQMANTATLTNGGTVSAPTVTIAGGTLSGTAAGKSSTASTRYITNKLSTVTLAGNIGGSGTAYTLALTGGSIQIANNLAYITPSNIGVLNIPVGYYTGTRAITGTLNAYLKTGTTNTAGLLSTILSSSTGGATEQKYQLNVTVGGAAALTKVEVLVNGASLQIPTIDASQDIVSTAIQFTAQGTDAVLGAAANYDVSATNDIRIRYFSN